MSVFLSSKISLNLINKKTTTSDSSDSVGGRRWSTDWQQSFAPIYYRYKTQTRWRELHKEIKLMGHVPTLMHLTRFRFVELLLHKLKTILQSEERKVRLLLKLIVDILTQIC